MQSRDQGSCGGFAAFLAFLIASYMCLSILTANPAGAQAWPAISCANSHIVMPPNVKAECRQGPSDNGGTQTQACNFLNYEAGSFGNAQVPHMYLRLKQSASPRCFLAKTADPISFLKPFSAHLREHASNWSQLQRGEGEDQIAFFDSDAKSQDGKCFLFTRPGPATLGGVQWNLNGFYCAAPGQQVDLQGAIAILKTIQVRS